MIRISRRFARGTSARRMRVRRNRGRVRRAVRPEAGESKSLCLIGMRRRIRVREPRQGSRARGRCLEGAWLGLMKVERGGVWQAGRMISESPWRLSA